MSEKEYIGEISTSKNGDICVKQKERKKERKKGRYIYLRTDKRKGGRKKKVTGVA